MTEHRLSVPSSVGLPPPSEFVTDMPGVPVGAPVTVEIGFRKYRYHYDGERLLRAHELGDCWCGGGA